MFRDRRLNVSNFLPDYLSTVNGVTVRGAVVVPNEESRGLAGPGYPESIAPTPILTAAQAGIPSTLRYSQKDSFAPRVGFAYRPFGDNKTVIRGGYGKYIVTLLGALVSATYGPHSANVPVFPQQLVNGQPTLRFPTPFQGPAQQVIGTQSFVQAIKTDYKDPYVQQWSLTIERELLASTALRLTYTDLYSQLRAQSFRNRKLLAE